MNNIGKLLEEVIAKYSSDDIPFQTTDIHLVVSADKKVIEAQDDDGEFISDCDIDDCADLPNEEFNNRITTLVRGMLSPMTEQINNMSIYKPFSFVLEDAEQNHLSEVYIVDDDTCILGGDLLHGLEVELDDFLSKLMKE